MSASEDQGAASTSAGTAAASKSISGVPKAANPSNVAPMIHLVPLKPEELPDHKLFHTSNEPDQSGKSSQNPEPFPTGSPLGDGRPIERPELRDFFTSIVEEAKTLMSSELQTYNNNPKKGYITNQSWKGGLTNLYKRSASYGRLDISPHWENLTPDEYRKERRIQTVKQAGDEVWLTRISKHSTPPTEQFTKGIIKNHSQNEKSYTPTVLDARLIMDWNEELQSIFEGSGYGMEIREMIHDIGFPFSPRIFPVLILSSPQPNPSDGGIVIQLPIDLTKFTGGWYSNGRNTTSPTQGNDKLNKSMVIGSYASIETIELFERGGEEDIEQAQKNILWRMTTVSSPNLPWLLNLLVPRWITERKTATEIAKDVPLFLDWNASRS